MEVKWIEETGPGGGPIMFKGELLGEADSRQDEHNGHTNEFATKGQRCFACRWSLYRIYRVDLLALETKIAFGTRYDGHYLVCSFGMTNVPGEETYRRVTATDSPAEVVELLTTRRPGQAPFITTAAARLLARVSDVDPKIQEAYDNRVVL